MLNEKKTAIAEQVERSLERESGACTQPVKDPCENCPVGGGCINVVCPAREERKQWKD